MPFHSSETIFTTQTLLWLAASLVAATLLFGSINRRRSKLTDVLRDFVNRNKDGKD